MCTTNGENQHDVTERCESLSVRVTEQDCQCWKGQIKAKRIQLPGRQNEESGHRYRENDRKLHRQRPTWQGTPSSSWIQFIVARVGYPVERHRRTARTDHCGSNPGNLPAGR